jgi:hypothetical protein
MAKATLYILKLTHMKWYIGVTDNWTQRYRDHVSGTGTEWTRLFKPMKTRDWPKVIANPGKYDELTTTLEYMEKYGINNVRGSFACYPKLHESMKEQLRKLICSCNDTCYKCGSSEHKANICLGVYVEPEADALTKRSNLLIFGERLTRSAEESQSRKRKQASEEAPENKRRRLAIEPSSLGTV